MASCDTFAVGNDTYNAWLTVCIESVNEQLEGNILDITYSVELRERDSSFFAQPEVEILLDGDKVYGKKHDPGMNKITRTITVENVPDGSHEVCIVVSNRSSIEL